MGIKHLWTVLSPFCDRKPLYELQGKTVAIDLSCWICEAQNVTSYHIQPRMYLRNLYFRTCCLLLMDVTPVFILEGKAPELKYDTIAARNAIQFKGAKPKTDTVKTSKGRTRFNFVLKQCEDMLRYMGLVCIKGEGEAESVCAYLNKNGLVDGCISQDSDCFAYGALIVYRNFSISTQGNQAAGGGSVDIYDFNKAAANLNLGRNKLIAMALLAGSDYSDGVYGIGKDSIMKFFETISDEEVLDRLRSWRTNPIFEQYEKQINDKTKCTSCGHNGRLQKHTKTGCLACNTPRGCDASTYKDKLLAIKNEVSMRNRAIQDAEFPSETLIEEFLITKDNFKKLKLQWKQPDVVRFVNFAAKKLEWDEIYAFEKILPMLTRWQCLHGKELQPTLNGILTPKEIKKKRSPKGVPSYEIIWNDTNGYFSNLIPDDQFNEVKNIDVFWSTIEPQNLIEAAYPDLVETFNLSKIKPKRAAKKQTKNKIEKTKTIAIEKPKRQRRDKIKTTKTPQVLKQFLTNYNKNPAVENLNNSFEQMHINMEIDKIDTPVKFHRFESDMSNAQSTPVKHDQTEPAARKKCFKFRQITPQKLPLALPLVPSNNMSIDFDLSKFGDEDDLDVSDIVDEIISQDILNDKLKAIINKVLEDNDVEEEKCTSFFAPIEPMEDVVDVFEETFNKITGNVISISSSNDDENESGDIFTEDWNPDNFATNQNESKEYNIEINGKTDEIEMKNDDDDSFYIETVPLFERIKSQI